MNSAGSESECKEMKLVRGARMKVARLSSSCKDYARSDQRPLEVTQTVDVRVVTLNLHFLTR